MMFAGRGRGKIRPPRRVSQLSVSVNVIFCVGPVRLSLLDGFGILQVLVVTEKWTHRRLRERWFLVDRLLEANHYKSMTAKMDEHRFACRLLSL